MEVGLRFWRRSKVWSGDGDKSAGGVRTLQLRAKP